MPLEIAATAVGKSVATTFAKKFTGAVIERWSRHRANSFFDAYRRVCLSKSKTIGPRLIGLLTGEIIAECRMASPTEECIFEAGELMSDADFMEFMNGYRELREDKKCVVNSWGSFQVSWNCEGSGYFGNSIDVSPFPWDEALGRWAVKLNAVGLLDVSMKQTTEQSRSDPSEGVETSIESTIIVSCGCVELYELLSHTIGTDKRI